MALFKIDQTRCDKDGLCALDCPAHIIEMTDDGPSLKKGGQNFCIQCGHCVAICPKAAFSLETLSPDQCMPIDRKLDLDANHIEHFLRSRRSIRRYKQKPVPSDLITQALSVACCAPTGSNRQSPRWLVINKQEDVKKVAGYVIDWMRYVIQNHPQIAQVFNMEALVTEWDKGIDRITRDAPMLVFAYASNDVGSAAADCHTALAYLELALPGFSLGSCWAGYVNYAASQWPALGEMLNLPEKHTGHGALMVGYPKIKYARAPRRNTPDVRYYAE